MIKATELRIGNWVNLEGHGAIRWQAEHFADYVKSEKDGYDLSHLGVSEVVSDKIEPIPLTPEILEKAGFKVDDKYEDVTVFDYVKNNECTAVLKSGTLTSFNIVFEDKNCKDEDFRWSDWHSLPVNYKYLHHLQNLYFDLTGEELNIKL